MPALNPKDTARLKAISDIVIDAKLAEKGKSKKIDHWSLDKAVTELDFLQSLKRRIDGKKEKFTDQEKRAVKDATLFLNNAVQSKREMRAATMAENVKLEHGILKAKPPSRAAIEADAAMEQERQRRMGEEKEARDESERGRRVAGATADRLAEEERARRLGEVRAAREESEQGRIAAGKEADRLADKERVRRITEENLKGVLGDIKKIPYTSLAKKIEKVQDTLGQLATDRTMANVEIEKAKKAGKPTKALEEKYKKIEKNIEEAKLRLDILRDEQNSRDTREGRKQGIAEKARASQIEKLKSAQPYEKGKLRADVMKELRQAQSEIYEQKYGEQQRASRQQERGEELKKLGKRQVNLGKQVKDKEGKYTIDKIITVDDGISEAIIKILGEKYKGIVLRDEYQARMKKLQEAGKTKPEIEKAMEWRDKGKSLWDFYQEERNKSTLKRLFGGESATRKTQVEMIEKALKTLIAEPNVDNLKVLKSKLGEVELSIDLERRGVDQTGTRALAKTGYKLGQESALENLCKKIEKQVDTVESEIKRIKQLHTGKKPRPEG